MPDSTDDLLRQLREKAFKEELDFQRKLHPEADKDMQERRARNRVFRHPRGGSGGIYDLSQQASGMRLPPKKKLSGGGIVQDFAKGGGVGFLPGEEASEQMGDIEYEVDMQSYLHDPLSRFGFDPKKIRVGDPRSEDAYSPLTDIVTMDPNYGLFSRETQAHEFRHRGLQRLLEDYFMSDPGRFKRQYGEPAFDLMVKIHKQQRGRGPVEDRVHERIAEMFQRPDEFSLGTVYETSDARVFQTLADAEAYARENPGVEFRASEIRPNVEDTLETPRVKEFRDYMINKLRGEAMRDGTDAEFEAVRAIQNAASDVLVGKYATGGRVSMGLGSLGGEYL